MKQRFGLLYLLSLLIVSNGATSLAAQTEPITPPPAAAGAPAIISVQSICRHTNLFSQRLGTPVSEDFTKGWQMSYPLLILDMGASNHQLYWASNSASTPRPIAHQGFAPKVSTTDNVIVLICNARQGDGSSINSSSVLVNGPDANAPLGGGVEGGPDYVIDRVFLLDAAKGSDVVRVDFVGPTVPKGQAAEDNQALLYQYQVAQDQAAATKDQASVNVDRTAVANEPDAIKRAPLQDKLVSDTAVLNADKAKIRADQEAAQIPERVTDTVATVLIERHKINHFSIGGGVLLAEGSPSTFSVLTTPTQILTTTTVNSTTVLTGTTTVTGTNTQITNANGTGTANFAYAVRSSRPQVSGIAGLTWYPFGHDTFPVSKPKGYAVTYSSYSWAQSFGVFVGTSVSSLGNFTVAPAMEVRPGIQVFAGATWYSKSYLPSNVVACTGYGSSPSFSGAPTTTSTQTTSIPGPPATTTTSTTTVAITTSNGCANGNLATQLAGSNIPTQTKYVPAFSFGFIFNTNLFKAFTGIK